MSSPVESTTDSQINAHRPIGQFIILRAWPDYFELGRNGATERFVGSL
jgi:hypothetical protein